jgi:DNA-binding CsgD family transcriptional regulator
VFRNPAGVDGLSGRELEVLLMVARGMSNLRSPSHCTSQKQP